jgi:hypothetical protein
MQASERWHGRLFSSFSLKPHIRFENRLLAIADINDHTHAVHNVRSLVEGHLRCRAPFFFARAATACRASGNPVHHADRMDADATNDRTISLIGAFAGLSMDNCFQSQDSFQ